MTDIVIALGTLARMAIGIALTSISGRVGNWDSSRDIDRDDSRDSFN